MPMEAEARRPRADTRRTAVIPSHTRQSWSLSGGDADALSISIPGGTHEVRDLLRAVGAAAVASRGGAHRVHERAGAGAAGRRAGLRPGVGGRASLPRGVLALLGAGAVPDRVRDADEEHPRGPRHRGLRAAVQPPDPHRRAGGRARHPLGRPARVRHRAVRDVDRTRRASRRTRTTRRRRGTNIVRVLPKMWTQERFGYRGRGVLDAVARRSPEAVPEAASADVGGGDDARDRARRGRPRAGVPGADVRRLRGAGAEDRGVPPPHQAVRARWRVRERAGEHGELPVLPRGLRARRRDGAAAVGDVQLHGGATAGGARGVSDALVSIAGAVAAAAAGERGAG